MRPRAVLHVTLISSTRGEFCSNNYRRILYSRPIPNCLNFLPFLFVCVIYILGEHIEAYTVMKLLRSLAKFKLDSLLLH